MRQAAGPGLSQVKPAGLKMLKVSLNILWPGARRMPPFCALRDHGGMGPLSSWRVYQRKPQGAARLIAKNGSNAWMIKPASTGRKKEDAKRIATKRQPSTGYSHVRIRCSA